MKVKELMEILIGLDQNTEICFLDSRIKLVSSHSDEGDFDITAIRVVEQCGEEVYLIV